MVCELKDNTPTLRYTLSTHTITPQPPYREIVDHKRIRSSRETSNACGDAEALCQGTKIQKTTMTWKTRKAARKILKTTKARA